MASVLTRKSPYQFLTLHQTGVRRRAIVRADMLGRQLQGLPADREARLGRAALALEGLSLGDAFGESFFGQGETRIVGRELQAGQWSWTDDTAMALSEFEMLAEAGTVVQDQLASLFAARYHAEPARGYGPGTHRLLGELLAGEPWRRAAQSIFPGGSYGNGAAMRAAVVGAYFSDDLAEAATQARLSAQITHAHPDGIAGGIAIAIAAAVACRPDAPHGHEFIDVIVALLDDGLVRDGCRRAASLAPDASIAQAVELLGNGSRITAQDTVPLALWCAAHHLHDYEQALWVTVSALGDRDTTCAIVGGIVAGHVGTDGLPREWLSRCERLPELRQPRLR